MDSSNFYTMKGYQLNQKPELTTAMEDYLEMIYRMLEMSNVVRAIELSQRLHVNSSSVTKMIQHLNLLGYVKSEKYGYIEMTQKGKEMGEYLLFRHNVVHRFLCAVNGTTNELEQAEKIEHFLNKDTISNIEKLTLKLEKDKNH